jgi:hypothetical protein
MLNLQKYDEFVNEGKIKDFYRATKFSLMTEPIRAFFKLMRIIFFYSDDISNSLKFGENTYDKIISFLRFCNNNYLFDKNTLKKSDQEIIELYQKLDQIYTEKYKSSLIDDMKVYSERLFEVLNKKGKIEKNKIIPILNKLITIIDKNEKGHSIEDPFGEEVWDDSKIINARDIFIMQYKFFGSVDAQKYSEKYLKQKLLGKTVLFIENNNRSLDDISFPPFKTKIKVKDIKWEKDQYIYIIDEKNVPHKTFLPQRAEHYKKNLEIKILD